MTILRMAHEDYFKDGLNEDTAEVYEKIGVLMGEWCDRYKRKQSKTQKNIT